MSLSLLILEVPGFFLPVLIFGGGFSNGFSSGFSNSAG